MLAHLTIVARVIAEIETNLVLYVYINQYILIYIYIGLLEPIKHLAPISHTIWLWQRLDVHQQFSLLPRHIGLQHFLFPLHLNIPL